MATSENLEAGSLERPEADDTVENIRNITGDRALKMLQKAQKTDEKLEIAGEVISPKQAYENLKFAFDFFREKFGIKYDLYFRQFPGSIVGESTERGIEIDPILLMHPVTRLIHAIAHELGHAKGKVDNEGLVEAYVKYIMKIGLVENDGITKTEKYMTAEKNFYEFIERIAKGKDLSEVINNIYSLYYSQKYEGIFELYNKRYIKTIKDRKGKDEAFDFFWEVFPEFQYNQEGDTVQKEIKKSKSEEV
ncbi:hypothetical protein GF366_04855 [Candidatus Peregrinibacteria bacterium]|nr:hypothetical protein [Candidatus Peregrinibacteria bacterium]